MKKQIALGVIIFCVVMNGATADGEKRTIERISYDIFRHPDNVALYSERSSAYWDLEQYNEALSDIAMMITLEPSARNFAGCGMGYIYMMLLKRDSIQEPVRTLLIQNGIQYLSRAIEIDPSKGDFYYYRGIGYFLLYEEFDRVIMDMTKVIEMNSNMVDDAYATRGHSYSKIGQDRKAVEDISMAIKLNPNTADYFYYRGMAYENMGNREDALRDFTSAIKINKNFVAAYISRASTYYGMSKYQEALDDLTEYIKRKPAADAYEGIAKIYRTMADQEGNIRKKAEYQKKADENFAILEQIRRTK